MARTTKTSTANPTEEKVINYIPLTDNYFYSADEDNYILYYFNRREKMDMTTRKLTGEILETYDFVGYYSKLTTLINATIIYLNRIAISEGEIKTLKDSVDQIKTTTEKLMSMLK